MNWVDLAVFAVAGISGILGLMRGFVRESLGLGAWAGAGWFAVMAAPLARPKFTELLGSADLADPAAYTALFIGGLIVLSLIAGWVGSAVHAAGLGGVDRSLGALFGLIRGAALAVAAYIVGGLLLPAERWPEPVRQARLLAPIADVAVWVTQRIPAEYRPSLPGSTTNTPRAADLMQVPAIGRPRP